MLQKRTRSRSRSPNFQCDIKDSLFAACSRERERIAKPLGSQFRVVCGVCYESRGQVKELFGANIETTALCGGLCAERAALSQLRMEDDSARVLMIAIVTDSQETITPGPMCREFLSEHFNIWKDDVPIVLQNCRGDVQSSVSIRNLWPFPNVYRYVPRPGLLAAGARLAATAAALPAEARTLYSAA